VHCLQVQNEVDPPKALLTAIAWLHRIIRLNFTPRHFHYGMPISNEHADIRCSEADELPGQSRHLATGHRTSTILYGTGVVEELVETALCAGIFSSR
jgi:hypothetical protein